MSEYRAGILKACMFSEEQIASVLPPEHRIAAVGLPGEFRIIPYLIEGPMLPRVAQGAEPLQVFVDITRHQKSDRVSLTARWIDALGMPMEGPAWEVSRDVIAEVYHAERAECP